MGTKEAYESKVLMFEGVDEGGGRWGLRRHMRVRY